MRSLRRLTYRLISVLMVLLCLIVPSTLPSATPAQAQSRPNVLMIVLDDLDLWTFERLLFNNGASQGSTCSQQFLKYICMKLYPQATYFSNAYVTNALCCPSRTTLLTGQYPHNHGIWQNAGNNSLEWFKSGYDAFKNASTSGYPAYKPHEMTINRLLYDNGYFTAMIGKLLNGTTYPGSLSAGPPSGWRMFYSLVDPKSHTVYDYEYRKWLDVDGTANDQNAVLGGQEPLNGSTVSHLVFQSDVLADQAINAMKFASNPAYSNPAKEFFVVLSPTVPHLEPTQDPANGNQYHPLSYAGQTQMRTRGRLWSGILPQVAGGFPVNATVGLGIQSLPPQSTATIAENRSQRTLWVRDGVGWEYKNNQYVQALRSSLAPQLANIQLMQKSRVEALMALDESLGYLFTWMEQNNKWNNTAIMFTSDHGYHLGEHSLTEKSTPFEEAIRVPLLIRAPGQTTRTTNTSVVLSNDLGPTMQGYAGVASQAYWKPDGRSLTSLVGTTTVGSRKQFMIAHRMAPWDHAPWNSGGVRRLNVFSVPHFNALRQLGGGRNALYARYSYDYTHYPTYYDKGTWSPAAQDPDPNARQNCEAFNMNSDPYQSTLTNTSPLRGCTQSYIDELQAFLACKQGTCAVLEDRINP